jgi:hypothetical protein
VKRSEESREELNAGLLAGRKRGMRPVMLTLTARHGRHTDLADFWRRLSAAEQELKRSRVWKKLNKEHLSGGFAKAVEATYSDRHGWHPHFHLVLMVDAANEAEAMDLVGVLREEWLHQLRRVDLDGVSAAAQERAFHVRGAQQAGSYVAKWGAAEELSRGVSKRADGKGLTPWQLLRAARTVPDERERQRMARLWWEFVQVFRGVHQLRQSPKYRALVAAQRAEEEALLEQREPTQEAAEVVVHNFGAPGEGSLWRWSRWKRLILIEAVEAAPLNEAQAAVMEVIHGDRFDRDLWDDDEDVEVVDDEEDPPPAAGPGRSAWSGSRGRSHLALGVSKGGAAHPSSPDSRNQIP